MERSTTVIWSLDNIKSLWINFFQRSSFISCSNPRFIDISSTNQRYLKSWNCYFTRTGRKVTPRDGRFVFVSSQVLGSPHSMKLCIYGEQHSIFYVHLLTVVERSLMVRWVVGSILHGGPIELFHVPASVLRLV